MSRPPPNGGHGQADQHADRERGAGPRGLGSRVHCRQSDNRETDGTQQPNLDRAVFGVIVAERRSMNVWHNGTRYARLCIPLATMPAFLRWWNMA